MDAALPKAIGRYTVERLLGAGAMGFVYLGRDPELDRPVAIKTVRDVGLPEEARLTFLERFRNEARAAARLVHSAIVQVYDVGEDPEVGPYLVLEYVPGASLKQVLKSRGPFDAEAVVRLALEIGEAIDAAHAASIIHRDIKPDNVLMTEDGHAKLADFGVARVPNASLTREGQFLGTPCYSAPETLGGGQYGPESDVFSFAALLYETVSGQRAFPGDDAISVAHKVLHDEPSPPSVVVIGRSVPVEVDAVLLRALSKDRSRRPESASALGLALRDAYERSGVPIPLELRAMGGRSAGHRRSSSAHGQGRAFGLALVVLVALGVGLVFTLGRAPLGSEAPADGGPAAPDAGVFASALPAAREPRDVEEDLPTRPEDSGARPSPPPDAGVAPPDAGPNVAAMSRKEREEAAKDALDRARELLAAGDTTAAAAAIDLAGQLDPGNGDVEALRAALP